VYAASIFKGPSVPYYYRGTTRGWKGSSNSIEEGITFVSTDPLVATLFAIECRNHGEAAVLLVAKRAFQVVVSDDGSGRINPVDLTFTVPECAVQLAVSTSELEQQASYIVEGDDAIRYLEELGVTDLPVRMRDRSELQEFVTKTQDERLSMNQIREFDRKVEERMG
jgi:hypothetical protein